MVHLNKCPLARQHRSNRARARAQRSLEREDRRRRDLEAARRRPALMDMNQTHAVKEADVKRDGDDAIGREMNVGAGKEGSAK